VRGLLLLLEAGMTSLATACTPWPLGPRLDTGASGLVGQWAAPPGPGATDTVVWLFRGNGQYEILRAVPGRSPAEPSELLRIAHGRWAAYRDARGDPRSLVCFDRRGRRWPSCRSFQVDSTTAPTGQFYRVLTWEGWVGETKRTTVALTERAPESRESP